VNAGLTSNNIADVIENVGNKNSIFLFMINILVRILVIVDCEIRLCERM